MIWTSSKIGSRVGALRSKLRGRLSLIERGCVHKIGKFANPSIMPPFHIFSSSSWSAGVINYLKNRTLYYCSVFSVTFFFSEMFSWRIGIILPKYKIPDTKYKTHIKWKQWTLFQPWNFPFTLYNKGSVQKMISCYFIKITARSVLDSRTGVKQ